MIFLNLTNGLLWKGDFDGFIRIQSCACEQKQWQRVLEDIDNNLLMWLAIGKDVMVVDYSARKNVPRALYQGLEWIWFCCCKAWNMPTAAFVKTIDCTRYFESEYRKLDKKVLKKLKYYRKFLNNPKKPVVISGKTDKDGNYDYFSKLAKTL